MNGAGDIVLSNGVDEHGPEDSSKLGEITCFAWRLLSIFDSLS